VSLFALAVLIVGAPAKAQDSKVNLFAGYSFGTNNFFEGDPGLHGYAVSGVYNFNRHIGLEGNFSGHNGTSIEFFDMPTATQTGEKDSAGQDIYTYVFGPRLTLPVGSFSLFSHVLVGGSHVHEAGTDACVPATGVGGGTCGANSSDYFRGSGSGMAVKIGGGVDWNHGRWGLRILEVDYVHSQLFDKESEVCNGCEAESFDSSWSGVEMQAGVTLNLGKTKN